MSRKKKEKKDREVLLSRNSSSMLSDGQAAITINLTYSSFWGGGGQCHFSKGEEKNKG